MATPKQVLKMAVGNKRADMRYDLNKDGKISSADALALSKKQTATKQKALARVEARTQQRKADQAAKAAAQTAKRQAMTAPKTTKAATPAAPATPAVQGAPSPYGAMQPPSRPRSLRVGLYKGGMGVKKKVAAKKGKK